MIYGWRPDADSKLPLYIQLANYYKQLVEKGIITEGYKLPGRNKLIDQLGISKTTVSLALERLVSEGVLTSKAKSGYFVAEQTGQGPDWNSYINKAKYQQWPDGQLASTLLEIRTKEIGIGQNLDVSRYLREASINIKAEDCSKFGLSSLRQNLAEYLKRYGINTNAENILITPQIMESMHLLYDAFVGHWTTFVHSKNSVINSLYTPGAIGMRTAYIPHFDDDADLFPEMEKIFFKAKMPVLQVQPNSHAPSGKIISENRKSGIIKLVQKFRVPVIELDPTRECWNYPNPIKAIDTYGNIIYLGSSMKAHPVEIPLSWIVAEPPVIEYLSIAMLQTGMKVDFISQYVFNEMLVNGSYEQMVIDMRKMIVSRREYALELMRKHLTGIAEWDEADCTYYFWLNFPGKNMKKLLSTHYINGVHSGHLFERSDTSHVLLTPATISEEQLETAILKLAHNLSVN